MRLEELYLSAGCNRFERCCAWNQDLLVYGSCNAVILVRKVGPGDQFKVVGSLVAHTDSVRSVRWISDDHFVSTSTDGTAVLWSRSQDEWFHPEHVLKGHSGPVTGCSGFETTSELWIATTSGDSTVKVWKIPKDKSDFECFQTIDLKSGFGLDLKFELLPQSVPMLLMTRDNCKVFIYGLTPGSGSFQMIHSLSGHEGWIHSIDLIHDQEHPSDYLLASGSQDSFIRVWRLSPRTESQAHADRKAVKDLNPNEDIKVKEEVFALAEWKGSTGGTLNYFAVSLETVMAGHEDKVMQVQWHQRADVQKLSLLSCSMDKTIIVWTPDQDLGGIWMESVRVGEVGGNSLGFLGCQCDASGDQILGYSFAGSFHVWIRDQDKWEPGVTMGGHFGPVEDLDWERSGRYLVSTSLDQTTRIHAPWRRSGPKGDQEDWHEVARPQVHGYDLVCLTMLPNHRFASGAEEKIVRTFEATRMFLDNLGSISQEALPDSDYKSAQGASVPSLGLSNKAVLGDESSLPEHERHPKDTYPEHYFKPEVYDRPPTEESLLQNSLWPELHKLYGHGYEVFCLASNREGNLIASACKATNPEHAEILLWEVGSWKIRQKLPGHDLTVTQMEFSPNDQYLLSVSRDRTWCLFERVDELYVPMARTDRSSKDKAVHQRILWSCSWSEDSKYFATCSRDKKLAVWHTVGQPTHDSRVELACQEVMTLQDSITAVAFAPVKHNETGYILAAGLENGSIVLVSFQPAHVPHQGSEWEILATLGPNQAHQKTVKKLKFARSRDSVLLASASTDHAVRLYQLSS